MTEEKMEVLKKHADWLMDPPCGDVQKAIAEAIWTAVDELSRNEKYRWHDLRKDSDDLPDMGNDVLIMIRSEGDGEFPLVGKYSYGDWKFSLPDSYHVLDGIYDVIAWKYIEPFEAEA